MLIEGDHRRYAYRYAAETMILSAPEKDPKLPEQIFNVKVTHTQLAHLVKVMSISKHPEAAFVGDAEDGRVSLQAIDSNNSVTDKFEILLDSQASLASSFKMIFKTEKMSLLMAKTDYNVTLCKGACLFVSESGDLQYYLMPEESSEF
jgi:hypothetical protein